MCLDSTSEQGLSPHSSSEYTLEDIAPIMKTEIMERNTTFEFIIGHDMN